MTITKEQRDILIQTLKNRFEKNRGRHPDINWEKVHKKLEANTEKLWTLNEMERTGGEPDVVGYEIFTDQFIFFDCAEESPKGRRSICYDREGLESRKEFKPENNAIDMCNEMGVEILDEDQYRMLQTLGKFDLKTSSWIKTPDAVRKLGGALFMDYRFGRVFVYHNGAQSYYGVRGFRGSVRV